MKFGEQLKRAGLLDDRAIALAIERQQRTAERFGECVVELKLCPERDVLRELARALGTRFVTAERLAETKVSLQVLERIPVRLAEAKVFIPFSFNDDELGIVMAEPQREAVVEEIARSARVEQVHAYLGLKGAIQRAIRKHYYRDAAAFSGGLERALSARCRQCDTPVSPDDFQCPRCELILRLDADEVITAETSVVSGLLTAPRRPPPAPAGRAPFEEEETTSAAWQLPEGTVPHIAVGLGLTERPLEAFEAQVFCLIDGRTSVGKLAEASRLSPVEVVAMLHSFSDRKLVTFHEPRQAAPVSLPPPVPVPPPEAAPVSLPPPVPVPPPEAAPVSLPPLLPVPSRVRSAPSGVRVPAKPRPPAETPESVLQRVLALEKEGRADAAIELLRESISTLKKPAPLYNRLALILVERRHDYVRAEALLRKAMEVEPGNSVYEMNLYAVLGAAREGTHPKARRPR